MRYELSDHEWSAIKPMLPNKPRGVRRVNDRRMLNGIPKQKSQVLESQSRLWRRVGRPTRYPPGIGSNLQGRGKRRCGMAARISCAGAGGPLGMSAHYSESILRNGASGSLT